jgi:hypothetical protein
MSTRADLRNRILDDLERIGNGDDTRINNAISDAIGEYQSIRLYFNESRSTTFPTVAGTDLYTFNTPTLTGTIGAEFYRIDGISILNGSTWDDLHRADYDYLELLADNNLSAGQPTDYAYIGRQLRIYPNPNTVYTIRVSGHQAFVAPTDDAVTDNVWMNEGFELIRAAAKRFFALHVIEDEALASRMAAMEARALTALKRATWRKTEGGRLIPTQF